LNQSSTYPTTEQTLSSLSTVVNAGGLGQIGDIIHNFNTALSGREPQIRELLTRLDNFVGVLDQQRDNIIASIQQLRRVAGTFAGQRDVLDRALKDIPPALDVLIKERPNLTSALQKLGTFSDTATQLVNDAGDDLVTNLKNLEPALKALADVGPDLIPGLTFATAFPYGPAFADVVTRGDYINLFAIFDLTYPRLKRTIFLGTRWGDTDAKLIPAPGDPWFAQYSINPLGVGVQPPSPDTMMPQALPAPTGPMPPVTEPLVPVVPPANAAPVSAASQIFAGPYPGAGPAAPAIPAHCYLRQQPTDTGRWWLMLTRFVRNQLIIFTIASIVGVAVMVFTYMQVPTLLGIGRINVTLQLPSTGGLYRFSNVTYRGVQVGKVTEVKLTETGAEATLTLDTSPKIPADLKADVLSVSAVGEQYVDLRPRTDSGPYLRDGSVIAVANTTIPQQVGPMLEQVSALVKSIPRTGSATCSTSRTRPSTGREDFQSC
jgi:ABC-type transporter Mla subunit MlaD